MKYRGSTTRAPGGQVRNGQDLEEQAAAREATEEEKRGEDRPAATMTVIQIQLIQLPAPAALCQTEQIEHERIKLFTSALIKLASWYFKASALSAPNQRVLRSSKLYSKARRGHQTTGKLY